MMPPGPWEIRHVELRNCCAGLSSTTAQATRVFFRLDGAVLGCATLLPDDLPLSAAELMALAAEKIGAAASELLLYGVNDESRGIMPKRGVTYPVLNCCQRPFRRTMDQLSRVIAGRRARAVGLSVSIIVCTRHRAASLDKCLNACAPELTKGREIVVVDNGPDEATRAVVEAHAGVRYVAQPIAGLSRARNAGIRASTGEIIVFTDDDVCPEPGWVDALLIGFSDPQTALTTGLVLPAELQHDAQIAFELGLGFGGMGFVPLRFDPAYFRAHKNYGVPVWTIGAGANMAIRRNVIDRIGMFDERIGPGAAGGCGDDSEFWYRILAAGFTGRYEPFSVVRHVHRAEMVELRRLAIGYMSGHVAALFVQFRRHRDWGNLRRALVTMPIFYADRFARKSISGWRGSFDFMFFYLLYGFITGFRYWGLAIKDPMQDKRNLQLFKV